MKANMSLKKALCLFAAMLLLVPALSFASDLDIGSLSYEDLHALYLRIGTELLDRPETKVFEVPVGVYEVGVHLPAGEYSLMPTSTYAAITVSTSDDFEDMRAMISISSVEESGIGRIVLKEGTFINIQYGPIEFSTFVGFGF
jgi:hypothetical protein